MEEDINLGLRSAAPSTRVTAAKCFWLLSGTLFLASSLCRQDGSLIDGLIDRDIHSSIPRSSRTILICTGCTHTVCNDPCYLFQTNVNYYINVLMLLTTIGKLWRATSMTRKRKTPQQLRFVPCYLYRHHHRHVRHHRMVIARPSRLDPRRVRHHRHHWHHHHRQHHHHRIPASVIPTVVVIAARMVVVAVHRVRHRCRR